MLALLADNTSGDLSEQDLRDMFVSLQRVPHGRLSLDVAANTAIAIAGTYYKAAGTTALAAHYTDFDDGGGADNRLRYTGVDDIHAHIAVSTSMTADSNNQIIGLQLAKNGVAQANTRARHKHATGTDIGSTALHGDFLMSTNDYIELFVTNETSTDPVQIEDLYVFALGMYV